MNKINKQNRNGLIDTENRLTPVRGEVGEKGEIIKQKIPKNKNPTNS